MGLRTVDGRTLRHQHRRPELLAAAAEYVLANGLADLSLRPVAKALGITHATLLRQFKTKDDLIQQVVQHVLADVLAQLRAVDDVQRAGSTEQLLRALWAHLSHPEQQRQFLLLCELVPRIVRDGERGSAMARAVVGAWRALILRRLLDDGHADAQAEALASLVVAQIRGLQIDLTLSGDRASADRAFEIALDFVRHAPSVGAA
jgi:AcrR family transcriptional regulator